MWSVEVPRKWHPNYLTKTKVDISDTATYHEQQARDIALANARAKALDTSQSHCFDDQEIICCDCADVIPKTRLNAQPFAIYCVYCQALRER